MVISTWLSGGSAAVLAGVWGSGDMARRLLLPLWRRGRLRVKLASASSMESRRGGEAGTVIAGSSAATDCAMSLSGAVMTVRSFCQRLQTGLGVADECGHA